MWRSAVALVGLVFVAANVWLLSGMWPPPNALPAAFPFRAPGIYTLSHAGAAIPLNYHYGMSAELRHAMDLGRLDAAGRRAAGIQPTEPTAYSSYGVEVVSPVDGIVLVAIDGYPDSPVGGPAGPAPSNHVAIHDAARSIVVWLDHLKPGSVCVRVGEVVRAGDPVGAVGNSGGSLEPHLHVCAQRYVDGAFLEGVPLTFDGRFLVRNSTVTIAPRSDASGRGLP
jgi:hypothetical protein